MPVIKCSDCCKNFRNDLQSNRQTYIQIDSTDYRSPKSFYFQNIRHSKREQCSCFFKILISVDKPWKRRVFASRNVLFNNYFTNILNLNWITFPMKYMIWHSQVHSRSRTAWCIKAATLSNFWIEKTFFQKILSEI